MTQNNKLSSASAVIPDTKVTVYEALFRRRMSWDFQDSPSPKGSWSDCCRLRFGHPTIG